MKRCFVALRITPSTRNALAAAQTDLLRLPRTAARKIRPVPVDNLHLTIKFLGATTNAQVDELVRALGKVAGTHPPFPATVEGLGAFPSPNRPRIVFGAVRFGQAAITRLINQVDTTCTAFGFAPESHPATPHVTIARIERSRVNGPITGWLLDSPPQVYGPIVEDELVLFESILKSSGATYQTLAVLPFAPK